MNSRTFLSRVPPSLLLLYRQAKFLSLGLGTAVLLCLVATLAALFEGPNRWWLVLAGTVPALFLPQFLYYHTLCNNDSLVNALGAAAILAFTLALGGGRREVSPRRSWALSLLTAALVGLAILTKLTATVLLPLLPALAVTPLLRDRAATLRSRLTSALGLLSSMVAVAFLAGGWWILRLGLQGDWTGSAAHRLAHPWAFRESSSGGAERLLGLFRTLGGTYVGHFTGSVFGVPDWIFLGYLLIPLVVGALALPKLVGRSGGIPAGPRQPLRIWVWLTLAGLVLTNVVAVVVNALSSQASHGRLLFPTLAASHALFALLVSRVAAGRSARIAPFVVLLALYAGLLFGWTYRNRMLEAVTQPAERVLRLSLPQGGGPAQPLLIPATWPFTIEHQLLIPPGRVRSLRVKTMPFGLVPHIGGALEGSLSIAPEGLPARVVPLRRTGLGDRGAWRWPELRLLEPLELRAKTPAVLELRGLPPWIPAARRSFGLPLAGRGERPVLCLAVVYDPEEGTE